MFNVSITQTVSRLQNLTLNNIESESIDHQEIEVMDDLTLVYEITHEDIKFWFEYNKNLFSADQISQMISQMQILLEEMLKNPQKELLQTCQMKAQSKTN